MAAAKSISVLFVCLGNICRSPLAEGLFAQHVQRLGLQASISADSCGTGNYHTGELADARTRANAASHNLELTHRARTFAKADFAHFDAIIVMDRQNEERVLALASSPADKAKVQLMRNYDPSPGDGQVPDPYFGDEAGFEAVYQILNRSTAALLNTLLVA
jgi:protein-tyrosine phosphatase